jgi:hypothetical protein
VALKHFWIPSFFVPNTHRGLSEQRHAWRNGPRAIGQKNIGKFYRASRLKRLAYNLTVTEAILMKALGVISTTALFLLLGTTLRAYAQDEHHEPEAKPAQHEEPAKPAQLEEQAKPEKQAAEAKPAKQEKQAAPEKQEARAKPATQEKQAKPEKQEARAKPATQEKQVKPEKQAAQAKSEKQPQAKQVKQEGRSNTAGQRPQRTAAQEQRQRAEPALRLSARGSGRIPDDRFRANFGESHTFVINQPVMVGGFSRFQYGGFWFGFVNPWPVGWYYTDNVYVDYVDGGYYLCNPYYPGARVSISVVI